MELLKNVDPKEYEKYARMYGITDFRGLLQAFELLKQSQEEETHRLVCPSLQLHPKKQSIVETANAFLISRMP